jgi:FdhD protein
MKQKAVAVSLTKVTNDEVSVRCDDLALEAPLEIQLIFGQPPQRLTLTVTMRTPSDDFELVTGFLFSEGIISKATDVVQIRYLPTESKVLGVENAVRVTLNPSILVDISGVKRHFFMSSSCGICGRTSSEMPQIPPFSLPFFSKKINKNTLFRLPKQLRTAQEGFEKTGGLHAAGLFDSNGNLEMLFEDVGRHNAMDKLIGAALRKNELPFNEKIILTSGRLSFELVQKAILAGVPVLAAVGSASSLAVELADEYGLTIIGFLKENSFNIYCNPERIAF